MRTENNIYLPPICDRINFEKQQNRLDRHTPTIIDRFDQSDLTDRLIIYRLLTTWAYSLQIARRAQNHALIALQYYYCFPTIR